MKTRHDNDVTDHTMQSTSKMKLNCWDLYDWVQSVMKTKQYYVVIDHTGAVYTKNETELSWPIRLSVIRDENQIEQQHDWSYRCDLRQKQ